MQNECQVGHSGLQNKCWKMLFLKQISIEKKNQPFLLSFLFLLLSQLDLFLFRSYTFFSSASFCYRLLKNSTISYRCPDKFLVINIFWSHNDVFCVWNIWLLGAAASFVPHLVLLCQKGILFFSIVTSFFNKYNNSVTSQPSAAFLSLREQYSFH